MRILKPDLRRWPRPTVPSVREKRAYYKLITGATSYRLSMVNGTAFLWVPGVDLTRYAGQTGSHTPFYVSVTDSTGKIAEGYIAAAGGGETLGSEILTNPSFDVNTTGWTPTDCTLASIAGGQSNNCCEMTFTGGGSQSAYESVTVVVGALYKLSGYYKTGTIDKAAQLRYYDSVRGYIYTINIITSGVWQQATGYAPASSTTSGRVYLTRVSGAAGTTLFDEISFKRVTDCAATGVHIVSANGGATRNWTSMTAGFNPNDTSYAIVIERIGNH